MRRYNQAQVVAAMVALVMIATVHITTAQDVRCRITELTFRTVRTPQFRDTSNTKATARYQWLQAYVEYETAVREGEWTDELTIDWTVLVRPEGARPIILRQSVTYKDIEEGTHRAVVYLRPNFIRRHTGQRTPRESDFAVYCEISAGGDRLARESASGSRQPDNWWRARAPNVEEIEGELLPRTDTPFANMDYDFYDYIKPKR